MPGQIWHRKNMIENKSWAICELFILNLCCCFFVVCSLCFLICSSLILHFVLGRMYDSVTYRIIIETANNFLSLMFSDIDNIIFRIDSIAIVVERHLSRIAADVPRFQVMEYTATYKIYICKGEDRKKIQ